MADEVKIPVATLAALHGHTVTSDLTPTQDGGWRPGCRCTCGWATGKPRGAPKTGPSRRSARDWALQAASDHLDAVQLLGALAERINAAPLAYAVAHVAFDVIAAVGADPTTSPLTAQLGRTEDGDPMVAVQRDGLQVAAVTYDEGGFCVDFTTPAASSPWALLSVNLGRAVGYLLEATHPAE